MAKNVKRKLNAVRLLIVFIILCFIALFIYFILSFKVTGFYISGNTYYSDQEVLNKTSLDKYPLFFLTTSHSVSNKVKNDKLINNIKIKKTLKGKFKVIVNENKILFYDSKIKKSVLTDGEKVDFYYEYSPVLVNNIEDKKIYERFLEKFSKINEEVLKNVSEIKYTPNDIDKERFLLSMNDGNYVYLTLSKISNVDNYLEISKTLGDKNGILYLDYGNYFVPKE